ncbi:MAG: hypothetical protein M3O62_17705 [Pseudomonadota bacterium]|nr:hypothetical protein [Pseudomonadota bacterium]
MIAGTSSWVDGRFVWTDYVYDDHGANVDGRPGGDGVGGYVDDLNENTADIVQVQLGLIDAGWSYRFVLQTLVDVGRPVTALAIDADADPTTGARALPGASWNAADPLGIEYLIIQRGARAEVLRHTGDGWTAVSTLAADVDLARNSIDVAVPHSIVDADEAIWRLFAVAGYADAATGQSWPDGRAIMDLAFVGDEPPYVLQSSRQGDVLAGQLSSAHAAAVVDFGLAAQRHTALATPPLGGLSTFLHHSRLKTAEGVRQGGNGVFTGLDYLGPYQPYLVWVPRSIDGPAPLLVYLHGASQNHLGDTWVNIGRWPYHGFSPRLVGGYAGNNKVVGVDAEDVYLPSDGAVGSLLKLERSFAPYDAPGIVMLPLGRMNSSSYVGMFEEDVLEALADIRERLPVDDQRISLSGSSMGGYGSFRLGILYPDLWAHVFPIIGAATGTDPDYLDLLGNLRNIPVRMHNGLLDPLIRVPAPNQTAAELDRLDYDYRFWLFERREHESLFAINHCVRDQAFSSVRARPAEIVFTQRRDLIDVNAEVGYAHRYDRAYWLSDLRLRDDAPAATVRAIDLTRTDRTVTATPIRAQRQNILSGRDVCGTNDAVRTLDTWTETGVSLVPGAPQSVSNAINLLLMGAASLALDLSQTGIDASDEVTLFVDSDGDARVELLAPWHPDTRVIVDDLAPAAAEHNEGSLIIEVRAGSHRYSLR